MKELYTAAKDEGMLSKLNEILSRQSSFPLENQIATVRKDRDDRLVQNESLTDDQALREALSEEGVQERLMENGVSREDVESLSSKLDKVEETIMRGIAELKEENAEMKAMLANQQVNDGAAANATEPDGNHVCIAVHPTPSLVAQHTDKLGEDFHRNFMMQRLRESLKTSFEKKALRACISSTDYGTIRDELLKEPVGLIYLGVGVGYEAPESGKSQRQILLGTCKLPPFVVVCLKYGAKWTAERLVGCSPAGNSTSRPPARCPFMCLGRVMLIRLKQRAAAAMAVRYMVQTRAYAQSV